MAVKHPTHAINLYYNMRRPFCFDFFSQLDSNDSYTLHIADFLPIYKVKQVLFKLGKVEFLSQKTIMRPSHQNICDVAL